MAERGKLIHEHQLICSINSPVAHVKRSESLHFSSYQMSHPAKPLVLSASTITSLPITTVSDNRDQFSYTSLFSAPDTNIKDLTAGIAFLPS
jgi:hypothetical protein